MRTWRSPDCLDCPQVRTLVRWEAVKIMLLESLNVVADASCALSITYTSSSELACIKVPEVVQTEELQSNLRCRLFDGAKADFTRPLLAFFQTLLTELQ